MLSFYIPRGIQVKRTNVFDKALKSFNQKARLPTFRLCNQAFLTVFSQEIEDLQSKKGIVRKPLRNHSPLPAEDHTPTTPRQTLRDLNLRHDIDHDADDRLKQAGGHPAIAPMTLGGLLESSAAFPVSVARQEMFEDHRKPFNRSEECPAYPTPELLVVVDEAARAEKNMLEFAHRKVQLYLGQIGKHVDIYDHITAQARFLPDSTLTGDFLINIQIDGIVVDNLARRLRRGQIAGGVGKRIQAFTALVSSALEDGGFRWSKIEQLAKELEPIVADKIPQFAEEGKKLFTFADFGRRHKPWNITGIEILGWMSEDSEVRQVIYDDLKAIGASVGWIWNIEFLYKLPEVEGTGYFVKVMSPVSLCKMSEEISAVGDERFKRDMVHDKQIAFASILVQTLDGNVYSANKIHELAEEVRKKALIENPKAEVHLVNPFAVAVILKDVIGGKYDDRDAYHNKVTFDIYPSALAHKHNEPIVFQIPLPYVGLFTLFKEEMLNELSIYPGLNKATIKDISDQDPATHNKHVRHLMSDAVEKVVQIEKRLSVVDAELYEYITPATLL